MIISLFGPDGVGKSTIAKMLEEKGVFVFSGTGVASWPDKSWHEEIVAKGLDETSIDDDKHFIEKIKRAHNLARGLEKEHKNVCIDSDPLHKTWMHDYLRGHKRYDTIWQYAQPELDDVRVHVYLKLSKGSLLEQTKVLQERIHSRGSLAYFDPTSTEQSTQMIKACEYIAQYLRKHGENVIEINTDDAATYERLAPVMEAYGG